MTKPDPVTVSPDEGPLPPIYVPPPGQPGPAGLLCRMAVRAAQLTVGWTIGHLPQRRHHVRHPH
jgi:hypothetical protein